MQDNFGRFSQAAFDARIVGVWEGTVNKASACQASPTNSSAGAWRYFRYLPLLLKPTTMQ